MSFRNLLGTTLPSFRISLSGPTIYQGAADPTPGAFNQGDVYLKTGSPVGWWFYTGAAWVNASTTIAGDVIATGDVEAGGELRGGDPFALINYSDPGPGMTTGSAGISVERNATPALWQWDEANQWWEPDGISQQLHVGGALFLGDGNSGTPSISFASDPGNGIYYDTTPIFASNAMLFATNSTPHWVLDQSGVLHPAGTSRDFGTAGIPVNRVYALTFRGSSGALGSVTHGFTGNNNTGMWSPAFNEIGFSAGGNDVLHITSSGLEVLDSTNGYTFQTLTNAGMYVNAGEMTLRAGGSPQMTFRTTGAFSGYTDLDLGSPLGIRLPDGTLANPSLLMGSSLTTDIIGIYNPAPNTIGIVTGSGVAAVERLRIDSTGLLTVDPAGTNNYENLVTTDDAIPNRKWVIDNVGAGGSPTEIQIHSAIGTLEGDSDFTWNTSTNVLGLNNATSSGIIAEGDLSIRGNNADAAGPGMTLSCGDEGSITITAGDANTIVGGNATLQAGSGGATLNGGNANVTGGAAGSGIAGNANISGGVSATGTGGNVVLTPGTGATDGVVQLGGNMDVNDFRIVNDAIGGIDLSDYVISERRGGGSTHFYTDVYSNSPSSYGSFSCRRFRGTSASPSGLQANDEILRLQAIGQYGGSSGVVASSIVMKVPTGTTVNGSSRPNEMQLNVTKDLTLNAFTALLIENDGTLNVSGNPVGYETLVNNDDDVPNKKWVDDNKLDLTGGTITGGVTFNTAPSTFNAGFTSNTTVPTFNVGAEMKNALYPDTSSGPVWRTGSGDPEGSVTAPVGSLYTRTDGTPGNTLYVKESGTGNTGWQVK